MHARATRRVFRVVPYHGSLASTVVVPSSYATLRVAKITAAWLVAKITRLSWAGWHRRQEGARGSRRSNTTILDFCVVPFFFNISLERRRASTLLPIPVIF